MRRDKTILCIEMKMGKIFSGNGRFQTRGPKNKISSKMKILQLTLKNIATIGVNPNLSLQPFPFNAKIFFAFLILSSYLICNLVFLFYESKTFTERIQSIYMSSGIASAIFCWVILIFNVNKLFETINACENLINTGEYRFLRFIQ